MNEIVSEICTASEQQAQPEHLVDVKTERHPKNTRRRTHSQQPVQNKEHNATSSPHNCTRRKTRSKQRPITTTKEVCPESSIRRQTRSKNRRGTFVIKQTGEQDTSDDDCSDFKSPRMSRKSVAKERRGTFVVMASEYVFSTLFVYSSFVYMFINN